MKTTQHILLHLLILAICSRRLLVLVAITLFVQVPHAGADDVSIPPGMIPGEMGIPVDYSYGVSYEQIQRLTDTSGFCSQVSNLSNTNRY